ncbi:MAG TPA: YebC/PmpR family DNA-binding transcriptional regulator, partial [Bacteroidales bacterium]|nr:YebC/PmpR family DNA-binding transcriptional regulator [Bacteroidales bacterium]
NGVFVLPKKEGLILDDFELEMIDAGAEEIEIEEDTITVSTMMENFGNMQKKLEELDAEVEIAELQRVPNDTVTLDLESAKKIMRAIEAFEDDDDVQKVFHNLELTEDIMAEL